MPPVINDTRPTALGVHIFAGGFTVGVKQAGFKVLGHLEDSPYGVATAKRNFPGLDVRVGEANWEPERFRGKVDFLYSNPPCAIFSSAGISTTRGPDAWRDDPRLGCWTRAFNVFEQVAPKAFALESVCQAYTKGREVVDGFTRKALALGYSVWHVLEDARWTGIPQSRKRFFFVAARPWLPLEIGYDFEDPPTVGDVLAGVADPGPYTDTTGKGADPGKWIKFCGPGERLSTAFDRMMKEPPLNKHGKVMGRPSFNCHRLRPEQPMGAFVGNFYVHPDQDRFLGTNEMRALCGYPPTWWMEGRPGGHASLLARAVMPSVARWLAGCVKAALAVGRSPVEQKGYGFGPMPTVTFVDIRKPPGTEADLTLDYTAWQEGDVDWNGEGGAPQKIVPEAEAAPSDPPEIEQAVVAAKAGWKPPKPLRKVTTDATRDRPSPQEKPLAGEGSGKFMQRLWMTGRYTPDEIVALVHANWEGRTTKKADLYYNYRKLVDAGTEGVPPWPGREARGAKPPVPLKPGTKVMATRVPRIETGPTKPVPLRKLKGRKALVTGMTATHCGSDRTPLKITTAAVCWARLLEEAGYDVDHRAVVPGEDLDGYEVVMIGLAPPKSIVSSHLLAWLWTVGKRPDSVCYLDDWQTHEIAPGFRSHCREDRLWKIPHLRRIEEGLKEKAAIDKAAAAWREAETMPCPVIACTHGSGGDLSKLRLPARIVAADPTAFVEPFKADPSGRERRWLWASLMKKYDQLEQFQRSASWPVAAYGSRDREGSGFGRAGSRCLPRLPEPQLIGEYARSWGIVMPSHPVSGTGWWRVRFLIARDVKSVVYCEDEAEARLMGPPYEEARNLGRIERFGDVGLARLARSQADCFRSVSWTKEECLAVVVGAIKEHQSGT